MKKVTMFILRTCPYCKQALAWMDELYEEHPEYKDIDIDIIDEREQPELSDSYDYYYVPTYFCDGVKLHEGAATKEKIEAVFNEAMK